MGNIGRATEEQLSEFDELGRLWLRQAIRVPENCEWLEQYVRQSAANIDPANQSSFRLFDWNSATLGSILKQATNQAQMLLTNARPIRLLLFDKSTEHNWSLPWHQDRIIAVNGKYVLPGYSNFSLKADFTKRQTTTSKSGVWHCEPPIELLQNMIFARIYLDDVGPSHGDMKLLLGSHHLGHATLAEIREQANQHEIELCHGQRGDLLFCKALILHGSQTIRLSNKEVVTKQQCKSALNSRKILRIDFSNMSLPAPLDWHSAWEAT